NRHRWLLPPFGAHTPASMILRISASGTGSGLSRRMARVVRMISKRSVVSGMLVLPGKGYSRSRVCRSPDGQHAHQTGADGGTVPSRRANAVYDGRHEGAPLTSLGEGMKGSVMTGTLPLT